MRIKVILVLILTILLTIVLMQNMEPVPFTILFTYLYIPKLIMLTAFSVAGFILGVLVASPRRKKKEREYNDEHHANNNRAETLSDEDKDYIS